MRLSRLLFGIALVAAPISFIGTPYLHYWYPYFHGCGFPHPPGSVAPFRLLALGDPQLEGDSSLPRPGAPVFPSLEFLVQDVRAAGSWSRRWFFIQQGIKGAGKDILKWAEGNRKRLDLWGNDYYLAHIVKTLRSATKPSHVAVLGDLLGSQWISDEEFERRAGRYWDRVFSGMERVPDGIMLGNATEGEKRWGGTLEILGEDSSWENRLINIAGNHDIGYAGDIDEHRVERFEHTFGKVNWDIVFTLPESLRPTTDEKMDIPALRIVVLNSMNLDTPAFVESLQRETYDFLNHVITSSRPVSDKTHATILLTHIPFHKEAGICVDSPFFDFFAGGSGVKEQNMLSEYTSKMILEGVFGLNSNHEAEGQGFGRRGIVINGHDHEGCDVLHYIRQPGVPSQCPENIHMDNVLPEFRSNTSSTSSVFENAAGEVVDEAQIEKPLLDFQPPKWQTLRYPHPPYTMTPDGECVSLDNVPHIREITLRSMMGEFSGSAGFLSAWLNTTAGERGEWKLEFNSCRLGVQHWWWAVQITNVVCAVAFIAGVVVKQVDGFASKQGSVRNMQSEMVKEMEGRSTLVEDGL